MASDALVYHTHKKTRAKESWGQLDPFLGPHLPHRLHQHGENPSLIAIFNILQFGLKMRSLG